MSAGDLEQSAVRLTLVARAHGIPGRSPDLLNLSAQSLVVRSGELLEPGQPVRLTLELATMGKTVEIDAVVVWRNLEQGDMALRFVRISEGAHAMLSRYLAAHT